MHGSLPAPAPADAGATLKAARAARDAGDTAGATALYDAYLAMRPDDLGVRLEHGWTCWGAGRRAEAATIWEGAATDHPLAAEPRMALLHAARADGDMARARRLVEAVLTDHPGDAGAWAELAVLRREGGDNAAAETAARNALSIAPDQPRALIELARAARARGATEEALAAYQAARRHGRLPPGAMVEEAHLLIGAGRFDAALERLADGVAAMPESAVVRLLAAQALRSLGRRREALALLESLPAQERRVAARAEMDRVALARPLRFRDRRARSAAEAGLTLAEMLRGGSAADVEPALRDALQDAHPFTAIGAARALLQEVRDAETRAVAALVEADAHGTLNMQRSAGEALERLAAEPLRLSAHTAARVVAQRAYTALRLGERQKAAGLLEDALRLTPEARTCAAMLEVVAAFPADPSPETCLALIEPGQADPRLRAWLADRVAARLDPADARLSMAGLNGEDATLVETLLRRNVALAQGRNAEAAGLLADAFARQGLAPPQPEGAPPGLRHFQAPGLAPVDGPLVSVIVSAFNAAQTIGWSLASVLAQSWRNLEVIVVDDASTDGTAAVVADIAAQDPRVVLLANARNAGTYASRNRAIAASRGAFITFLDSDDWMHPARIASEVAGFARPGVEIVNSCWFRMDEAGRAAFSPRAWLVYANPSFAMFRRDTLRRLGEFDRVRFSADSEMMWRARLVLGGDAIAVLPQTLTVGLYRPGSLTTAAASGFDAFGFSAPRCAYNEGWGAWHADCDEQGRIPAPPFERGYPLPDGMAAGEAT